MGGGSCRQLTRRKRFHLLQDAAHLRDVIRILGQTPNFLPECGASTATRSSFPQRRLHRFRFGQPGGAQHAESHGTFIIQMHVQQPRHSS